MSDLAISVNNVGKSYRLDHQAGGYKTLRETITSFPRRLLGEKNVAVENFWALKDISFNVHRGECVGIIGRNGVGKSTLLKILSRITAPTTGKVEIYQRVGTLLEVGTGFHPELTGRENIFLNGAILGMTKTEIRRKFSEIVSFAEVDKFLDTPVKHYSSGMYVRLAFAVAAHLNTDILFVDEVLSVGDISFQKKCLAKMQDIGSLGRTVLFVSHNMGQIVNLCPRTLLINKGRIELDGSSKKVVSHYLSTECKNSGQITWDDERQAPGSNDIKLLAVKIVNAQGKVTALFDPGEEIFLKILYRNYKNGAKYILNINLKDEDGTWVFTTVNAPSANIKPDPWFDQPHPQGVFEATCQIPPYFLNCHTYFIYIAIGLCERFPEPELRREDEISFTVHDNGSMSREYKGSFIGSVRPKLFWITKKIEIDSR